MTTTTTSTSHTAALVANTEDIVKLSQAWDGFKVTVSGAGIVYFRSDGGTATVAGDGCHAAVVGLDPVVINQFMDGGGATTRNPISLISSGTPTYTVEGVKGPFG